LIGPALSVLISKFNGWDEKTIADKCYEIRCDNDALVWVSFQQLVYVNSIHFFKDRSTAFFAFIGWYWKRFQGAVDGANLAIAYTVAYLTVSFLRFYTF
jgi:hypothetical protein